MGGSLAIVDVFRVWATRDIQHVHGSYAGGGVVDHRRSLSLAGVLHQFMLILYSRMAGMGRPRKVPVQSRDFRSKVGTFVLYVHLNAESERVKGRSQAGRSLHP